MNATLKEAAGKRIQSMKEFVKEFGKGKMIITYTKEYEKTRALYGTRSTLDLNKLNDTEKNNVVEHHGGEECHHDHDGP